MQYRSVGQGDHGDRRRSMAIMATRTRATTTAAQARPSTRTRLIIAHRARTHTHKLLFYLYLYTYAHVHSLYTLAIKLDDDSFFLFFFSSRSRVEEELSLTYIFMLISFCIYYTSFISRALIKQQFLVSTQTHTRMHTTRGNIVKSIKRLYLTWMCVCVCVHPNLYMYKSFKFHLIRFFFLAYAPLKTCSI